MIAFKEWSLVCDALGAGRQSIILRKGGIAEGRSGFSWKHDEFALFPTHFHEQQQALRGAEGIVLPPPELAQHTVSLMAKVEFKTLLTDWAQIMALMPYHAWTEEILRERFDYTGERTISLAVLRVFRLAQPLQFPDAPGYGGCRSWVTVPDSPVAATAVPVLDDHSHTQRVTEIRLLLGLA
jgi:hypothetical protein